jgi:hypothetical protein
MVTVMRSVMAVVEVLGAPIMFAFVYEVFEANDLQVSEVRPN